MARSPPQKGEPSAPSTARLRLILHKCDIGPEGAKAHPLDIGSQMGQTEIVYPSLGAPSPHSE